MSAHAENSAWNIELELGSANQVYNNVQIPNKTGTRFSLSDLAGNVALPFYRIELFHNLSDKHQLRILYAPFSYTSTSILDQNINFEGKNFTAGNSTKAKYQFNSYRLTYRYLFYTDQSWQWYVGGTLKIRDAEIALEQNSLSASNSNIGLVPLFNLYGKYQVANDWQFIIDFDGLAGPQGYAVDLGLKLHYDTGNKWYYGGGIRTLGGGADNDTIYNFAQFSFAFASFGYRF